MGRFYWGHGQMHRQSVAIMYAESICKRTLQASDKLERARQHPCRQQPFSNLFRSHHRDPFSTEADMDSQLGPSSAAVQVPPAALEQPSRNCPK